MSPSENGEGSQFPQRRGSDAEDDHHHHKRRSTHLKHQSKSIVANMAGVVTAIFILLVFAGATFFFLTRTPDDERLLTKGREELSRNQYAFAVETLNKAAAKSPKDPRVFLLLARAYVGISDVDKAWESISHAQQLGKGVVAEPDLASDLANYYMKRQQYDKAIDLLRPLAKENIGDKKSELADLDAAYGDSLLGKGDLEGALRCWEEVKTLQTGSRLGEAEARLTTIYEKLATKLSGQKKDEAALGYLSKLTTIAKNPKHYLTMADIYERSGKLDLAIEQLRKANELSSSTETAKRLSVLLSKRGKELMDDGNHDTGYAYLQQARSMDASNSVPDIVLRAVNIGSGGGMPKISGEIWNPTDNDIGKLTIRAELWDNKNNKSLWSKDTKLVDEFVRPLGSRDSKSFSFTSGSSARYDGTVDFRVFIDGVLYKAYTLEKKGSSGSSDSSDSSDSSETARKPPARAPEVTTPKSTPPPTAPPIVSGDAEPQTAPTPGTPTTDGAPVPMGTPPTTTPGGVSPEEKTIKDLGF
ncbi:MAG: hypothetical protein SGJ27_01350 [Candidatus Melainabacteria bacterium]|nr:hypothetical protein [Candidatus Melainabacteria bacterium]